MYECLFGTSTCHQLLLWHFPVVIPTQYTKQLTKYTKHLTRYTNVSGGGVWYICIVHFVVYQHAVQAYHEEIILIFHVSRYFVCGKPGLMMFQQSGFIIKILW